ncbi:MAG: class I SAM-dependent methyltransferase [Acidobacteria bacterium]|nr:class I SAM-dependent methyltransferase [Acidobacteriota bacterium]MBV9625892.1 class I SAM-dependent methyltransferase [Acidobacteriota bacterium]
MEIQNTPVLGGTAPRHAWRTANKLADFALRWCRAVEGASPEQRYLDVGCGNGFITELVAPCFDEVVGIDIEGERLGEFRAHTGGKSKFRILEMSAARMEFPSNFFSCITSFEVLEHVTDVEATVREMARVCKPGGIIVISVPQVWFPFENHGARIGQRTFSCKIPILPYIRPLHRRYSLARVFSSAEIDQLFVSKRMKLLGTSYASPQFERAAVQAHSWESKLVFLAPFVGGCEKIPFLRALSGVSLLKAYRKMT